MAKYLTDSTDIEIEEVSGTENIKFNFASGNSTKQMIGDLSNLSTTNKTNVVNAINEVNTNITNLNTYSTTETVIGTWINGKPIYRKVINFGSLPNATTKTISHNISNMDYLINIYGIGKRTNDGVFIPLQFVKPDDPTGEVGMFANTSEIFVIDAFDRSNITETYIVMEYTKN